MSCDAEMIELAVARLKMLLVRQHQHVPLGLRPTFSGRVDGHLVTVEVGVETAAHQQVGADGVSFHQHRLERLDAHSVERSGGGQKHRMLVDDFFQNVPHSQDRARPACGLADLIVSARPCSLRRRIMNG